ncbi:outer membrane protein assembly factor BamB family protein [Mariniblastus fucicola]|uniref:outer membrane protein assembly factor BamB family protein n=1 Tax=Mariniblastus fucicola TaxID=980251 RepID=UPI00138FF1C4|nr:PQQ-binding-like beta-propeller repeat protein [Mariniblastus fucicola]
MKQPISRPASKTWYLAFIVALALVMLQSIAALAEEGNAGDGSTDKAAWSSFRGAGNSTVSPDASIPLKWSPGSGISWQVELPGYGQSSPLVFAGKVLVTAVEGPQKEKNLVVCVDRESGETLWRYDQSTTLKGPSNFMYSRAAPTPIADRSRVVAFFESGDLIAVGLNSGKKLWSRDLKEELGPLSSRHGLGSSLAQTDDLLFINLEHDGPSALLAIQKSDGATKWKSERPSGSSWSSPAVMQRGDQTQVVVSSGGEAAGYDAETGRELWKIIGLAGNSVPSPLVVENRIYLGARLPEFGSVATAAKSNLCLEFEEGATEPEVAWRSKRCVADYASPVVCGDNVFLINGDGILGCLDKNTGEEKYRQRLGMVCWATPIVHDNHLFIFGKNGKTTVLKAGGQFSKVGDNHLWDSADPPRPVSYVEYFPSSGGGGHGHGGHGSHGGVQKQPAGHAKHASGARHSGESKPGTHSGGYSAHAAGKRSDELGDETTPGAGMLTGMLKRDVDGDGLLSGDEIPGRLNTVMENIDLNKDGRLDKSELKKMADSFAAKRKNSKQSSRDPIVYGVAADSSGIIVRTGTRLYAIGGGASDK